MHVDIITIGDELLIGQVVDTNSAWMGQELNKNGFTVHRITSISDSRQEILDALEETTKRSQIVLITGGLGPTRDDITKGALCDFFGTELVLNEQVLKDVQSFLRGRVDSINQLNHDQALVPKSATVIRNAVGTAPILWFERNGTVVVSMPGVPSEMKRAMKEDIFPRISKQFTTGVVIHKTVHIHSIPEAVLAEMLSLWEYSLPEIIKVAYLPSPGKIRLRLSSQGADSEVLKQAINNAIEELKPIVGKNIYAYDDILPAEGLINLLKLKEKSIGFAESCSGGLMAHLMTSIAGSSEVFKGSIVAYSNQVKTDLLEVSESNLRDFGAVSKQVVEQMAEGALKVLKTDFAIATSGVAGPGGGTPEKPVGTIWIAWASERKTESELFTFSGNSRERNILRTAEIGIIRALQMMDREEW